MKKTLKLIAAILWMAIIFILSSEGGELSADTSSDVSAIVYKILKFIIPTISISMKQFSIKYVPLIRKIAHFTEFFILGILIYFFIKDLLSKKMIIVTSIICFIYAISDELHQYFVPGRYCSFKDVLIDTSGALLGIILCHFLIKKWKK